MTNLSLSSLPEHANGVTLCLEELLLYQQQAVKWLPPAKSLWAPLLGQHQSRQLGRGMDFAEVRQYQAGDDIRSIDWRVTARTGKPHTKLFCEEREKPVVLYVDFSPSMQFGSTLLFKSVQAAHMASLISWLAVAQQDRIGAVIDLGNQLIELKPTARRNGALRILSELVSRQTQAQQTATASNFSMQEGLLTLDRLCPKGSEIILLSDFVRYDDGMQPLLSRLSRHNQVRIVQIADPLEQGITAFRGIERVRNNQHTRWLNFSANNTRDGIKKSFESQKLKLKLLSQRMAMDYRLLSCGRPLLPQLSGL